MRHLVTGGSGFLGNLIVQRLLEKGESVRVLDIWKDPAQAADVEFIKADIRNEAEVERAMQGIDVVHHNVALVPLSKAGDEFRSVNVDGSRIAARAAVRANVSAFVNMSSSAIFGVDVQCPITPETVPHPAEIYGQAKLDAERAVADELRDTGMQFVNVRPRAILGQGRLGIFHILFDWIRANRNVYVFGSGNNPFQFVHADDLMDAYMLILQREQSGVYNVGTDRFGTMRECLEHLVTYAKSRSRVVSLPAYPAIQALKLLDWAKLSPLGPYHYLAFGKEIHFDMWPLHALGWRARYSNDEMLRVSYDSFLTTKRQAVAVDASDSPHRRGVREGVLRLVKLFS